MIFDNFSWWWAICYLLITTHITILTVTIYLHRAVAHRSLEISLPLEHFFRFWCWLNTGQGPKEWAAVHRKHHAFCDKQADPHSPQIYGIWRVLFGGLGLYRREASNRQTIEKYGKLIKEDWLDEKLYKKHSSLGLLLLGLINLMLFGIHGLWIYGLQLLWIPFWAAGVVNGVGHYIGYRNFQAKDHSVNIFPIGLIIGGEELHNNHHAYPSSAKLSVKWYEFDAGWFWIKLLSFMGLVRVKNTHQLPSVTSEANFDKCGLISQDTASAILKNQTYVMTLLKDHTKEEVSSAVANFLKYKKPQIAKGVSRKRIMKMLYRGELVFKNDSEANNHLFAELMMEKEILALVNIQKRLLGIWEDKGLDMLALRHLIMGLYKDVMSIKESAGTIKFTNHLIRLGEFN